MNSWQETTFCSVVLYVYESTNSNDRGLGDVATESACQNAHALKSRRDFQNLIGTLPAFMADLLRRTWGPNPGSQSAVFWGVGSRGFQTHNRAFSANCDRPSPVPTYQCTVCHKDFEDPSSRNSHYDIHCRQHNLDRHHYCRSCTDGFSSAKQARGHKCKGPRSGV